MRRKLSHGGFVTSSPCNRRPKDKACLAELTPHF
jgi:hypothetical protein